MFLECDDGVYVVDVVGVNVERVYVVFLVGGSLWCMVMCGY